MLFVWLGILQAETILLSAAIMVFKIGVSAPKKVEIMECQSYLNP